LNIRISFTEGVNVSQDPEVIHLDSNQRKAGQFNVPCTSSSEVLLYSMTVFMAKEGPYDSLDFIV